MNYTRDGALLERVKTTILWLFFKNTLLEPVKIPPLRSAHILIVSNGCCHDKSISELATTKIIWLQAWARYYCWRASCGPRPPVADHCRRLSSGHTMVTWLLALFINNHRTWKLVIYSEKQTGMNKSLKTLFIHLLHSTYQGYRCLSMEGRQGQSSLIETCEIVNMHCLSMLMQQHTHQPMKLLYLRLCLHMWCDVYMYTNIRPHVNS